MAQPPNTLPLPAPWRLLFQGLEPLKTDSAEYAMLCDLADGGAKSLPMARVNRWDVDQGKGTFTASLTTGQTLAAEVQFLGSHDGATFQWADSNPSIDPPLATCATATQRRLPQPLAEVAQADTVALSPRDMLALLGLAATVNDCDLTVAVSDGSTQLALLLRNVTLSDPAPERDSKPNGLIGRISAALGGRAANKSSPPPSPPPSLNAQLAALRDGIASAMTQWQRHLLPNARLRALEPDLARIHTMMQAGEPQAALDLLDDVKVRLGPQSADQEPTGWVSLCEGLAATQLGDLPRARAAFAVAGRAIVPVPALLRRIAEARAAEPQDRTAGLKAAYLTSPERFIEMADADEATRVKDALTDLSAKRAASEPEAVLSAVIKALCDIEFAAHRRGEAAATQRQQDHVLEQADFEARRATDRDYADLLLTWTTPNRAPMLGSYSSDPELNPDRIAGIETIEVAQDSADFLVRFKQRFTDELLPVTYTLKRVTLPLGQGPDWRLDSIVARYGDTPNRRF